MTTTNGTYPCASVTQIFRYGCPNHDGGHKTFGVMTSALPLGFVIF